jgi:predicted porin
MKTLLRSFPAAALFPVLAFAVYAPIPEQEQGKALSYRLGASAYYDSNIFGSATAEIDSLIYNVSGEISYNGSIDDQTFASGSYLVSNDYVVDRPGTKNLTSHSLSGRLAHAFAPDTTLDLSGAFNVAKNPQSLLAGTPLNTDQSYNRAQFDARYTTSAGPKTGVIAKYRFINFAYDNPNLSADLDRSENLFGLEANYAYLPETKLVVEYRYQTIGYDTSSATKDKNSHYVMGGVDYNPGKQLLVSGRAGLEKRERDSGSDTTVPYVELSSRYTYTEGSYLAGGYSYTFEEPSDVDRFTDTQVNRFFVNLQHQLSGAFTASGSLTYEPSELQGRTVPDIDETTTRLGVALSWRPNKNWTVTGTYDYDDISSDDASRGQNRDRLGVAARFTF